ncbi:TIGR03960 family B12-binding radical SAM protein [Desulfitobacterium sp.]|uniref:TIGR03960 family B12-binding radical SAM protein n=1 Tax=Desulfitobacterium sp. TaxID=49981 RepID=UPI002C4788C3|nr:TIGR03960 family B12-binding radical SAM protein [Desulfitobacterium sp.]HVJ50148.1 TIGR03960 family B12-binding radical SAM protein [Desulfitobacterium sp.]
MSDITAAEIHKQVERFLSKVQKPSRYLGSEWNSVHKDWEKIAVHMAFAFPDVYEVGMSHLGTRILYALVNSNENALCERVFAPWVDMEEKMREKKIPLYALESYHPLQEFDIIGFTLQYEMSFSNILNMLDLAGIPLRAKDRGPEHPWIIAGGPCAFNPEPLAPFIDFFMLGDGEETLPELLQLLEEQKKNPVPREEFLLKVTKIQGAYVSEFYEVQYKADGRIEKLVADPRAPKVIEKAIVQNLDQAFFPTNPIVPYMEIVHDRMMLEVMRGCSRGCRFCQAGIIYRPVRERSPETLQRQTDELVKMTGYEEIALTSLSTGDYSCVQSLIHGILEKYSGEKVSVSLPSLRLDSFDVGLAQEVQTVRKSGLTFAPEAGTQRLRDVINKGVTEENLMQAAESAFKAGWSRIKLYFMIGLPTETQEDIDGIAFLAKKVAALGTKLGRRNVTVTVSTSSFVPKSHTPFQWEPQEGMASLEQKQRYLREKLRDRRIKYNYHDVDTSYLEAVFAKGDRRLADALEWAFKNGCKFDGWAEHFKYDTWIESFKVFGLDPHFYANRVTDYDDVLPWDHLESGVTKRFLAEEHRRALQEARTMDCRNADCTGCGICPGRGVQIDLKG